MKKAEELMLYTPEPQRPPLDAKLCISVAAGEGKGRYIKGKTLTVAVWGQLQIPSGSLALLRRLLDGCFAQREAPYPPADVPGPDRSSLRSSTCLYRGHCGHTA